MFREIIRLGGLESEDKYPYDARGESCHVAKPVSRNAMNSIDTERNGLFAGHVSVHQRQPGAAARREADAELARPEGTHFHRSVNYSSWNT